MMLLSSSGSWGSGWWGLCGVFMVICMVMMMVMMRHGSHGSRGSNWSPWSGLGEPREHEPGRPEQTLADRLARGQIDIDEYERRRTALRKSSVPGH